MSHRPIPVVSPRHGVPARVVGTLARGLLAVSLLVSPRPAVAVVKRAFDAGGVATAAGLARHAPTGVETREDVRYGSGPDETFDMHRPAGADGSLPVVLWIHGGGWVAGSKEELRDYLRLVAADGVAVVAPAYTLAPRGRYPGPLHQVAAALRHVCARADELRLDADRIVVAGDSAGAQLAAQLATVTTSPEYSQRVGVAPPVEATRLHGVVLACGPYDIARLSVGADSSARPLMHAVLWAYSGRRRYARDRLFATASVLDHVTGSFPPALVTVGNADPLREHSRLLVQRLRDLGCAPETLFFPDDHVPPLGHEYQFDLDTEAAQEFRRRLRGFLADRLVPASRDAAHGTAPEHPGGD